MQQGREQGHQQDSSRSTHLLLYISWAYFLGVPTPLTFPFLSSLAKPQCVKVTERKDEKEKEKEQDKRQEVSRKK